MYEGLIGETITITGHNGDAVEAYYARPIGAAPVPGVVVIHHMPGWDEWTKEVVRKFAHHGYAAIAPHLFSRLGKGDADDMAALARSQGGVSDDQAMGDIAAGLQFLRSQPNSTGKIGAIGFCSGGRQAYLAAARIPEFDAIVDCWGGGVIVKPEELTEKRPVAPIDLTAQISVPLLGIYGNEDANPDPEQVNRTEAALKQQNKTYEFHRYDGAGHGFFAAYRPAYRPEQATDGWSKVFDFLGRYLGAEQREPAAAGVA